MWPVHAILYIRSWPKGVNECDGAEYIRPDDDLTESGRQLYRDKIMREKTDLLFAGEMTELDPQLWYTQHITKDIGGQMELVRRKRKAQ